MSKACEYIKELRQSNLKLGDDISTLDRLRIDNQLLRQEVCQSLFRAFKDSSAQEQTIQRNSNNIKVSQSCLLNAL